MGKVKSLSSHTSQGEERLLESQTECNIVSEQVNVFDCRWNGSKYDYGAKATISSKSNQRPICKDSFVRYFSIRRGSIFGCLDRFSSKT